MRVAALFLLSLGAFAASLRGHEAPTPAELESQVGFDQKLGGEVPLAAAFKDEQGRALRLGDCFGGKPVLLTIVYYNCPVLCTEILNDLARSLREVSFTAGREFNAVTVSVSPTETPEQAAEKKQITLQSYQRPGAESGWTFLTGGPEAIREVTAAVGFRYAYVHETKEYAHPSGAIVLTPEGRVSRYFFGLSHSPRDLRLALVEASDGKIGSPVDQLLLLCYHYDPKTGKYSLAITRLLRAAGLFTLLALGTFVAVTLRRERRMRKAQ